MIPAGFLLIAWRIVRGASPKWRERAATAAAAAAFVAFVASGIILASAPFVAAIVVANDIARTRSALRIVERTSAANIGVSHIPG